MPLQGMTANYAFTGDTTDNYILFPMTKDYTGTTFTYQGVQYNDVHADVTETGIDNHTLYDIQHEGFSYLYVTNGTLDNPINGILYIRVGSKGGWSSINWNNSMDFIIKPTNINYTGNKQILSTPFLFYFGLRPGKTAVDKFTERFGPKGAFPSAE